MGCSQSIERKLYNEDVDIKRKFMVGIHFSKGGEGMEGNFQVALGTTRNLLRTYKVNQSPLSLRNLSKRRNDLNFQNVLVKNNYIRKICYKRCNDEFCPVYFYNSSQLVFV